MRTIRISMAICSHLSDAQHLMMAGCLDEANKHINFVKLLTFNYDNIEVDETIDKLNEIWNSLK